MLTTLHWDTHLRFSLSCFWFYGKGPVFWCLLNGGIHQERSPLHKSSAGFTRSFDRLKKKVLNFEGPFPGLEKVWKNGQSLSGSGESLNFFQNYKLFTFQAGWQKRLQQKIFLWKNRRKSVTNVDVGRESIVVLLYHWWVVTRCFQIKEGD